MSLSLSTTTINVDHAISACIDAGRISAQIGTLIGDLGDNYDLMMKHDLPGAISAGLTTYAEISRRSIKVNPETGKKSQVSETKVKYDVLAAQVYALGGMNAYAVREQVVAAFYAINKSGVESVLAGLPDRATALEACAALKSAIVAKGPDPKMAAKVEAENVAAGHAPAKPKGPGRPPASLNDRLLKVKEQAGEHNLSLTKEQADAHVAWIMARVKA